MEARVLALEGAFRRIARERMAGLPMLNPALAVQAVGFERAVHADGEGEGDDSAVGILITPWFMNLVWLPLQHRSRPHLTGHTARHALGGQVFEFIGAHDEAVGSFGGCSLFSPMFEFTEQAAAVGTAQAVLGLLRAPQAGAAPPVPQPAPPAPPARRAFLFGRSAAGAAPA